MNKARQSSSVQSTQTQRSDLLRAILAPKVIAEYYQKQPTRPQINQYVNQALNAVKTKIMVYRPVQRPVNRIIKPVSTLQAIRNAFNSRGVLQDVSKKTLCKRRSDRREQLFSMGVAGYGRRRSPGQGGSYKRDQNSRISC